MALKNTKIPVVVAAVVIAAVAIGTFVARRSGDDAPAGHVAQSQMPDPASPPSSTSAGNAGTGPRTALDSRARIEETIARRRESREAQIKRSEEQRKKAAEAFAREPVDPAWAPKKETELNTIAEQPTFEQAGAIPKEMRIECKSSMCRIDSSFTNNGQAEDWTLMYMSSVGSTMPNAVVKRIPNPDGTTRVEIYGRAR